MVAPIDAFEVVKAGDEQIILRLNFAAIARCHAKGIDLFDSDSLNGLTTYTTAILCQCLAQQDQPDFTDEQAFAVTLGHAKAFTTALFALMNKAVGKAGDENPPKADEGKPTA